MKFIPINNVIDMATDENGLLRETTLQSAVLISLLTDRRALPDDRLPETPPAASAIPADRRGWAGDALADTLGDRIGSRLWLLRREKKTEETRKRAIFYCQEALQWLLDDGIVTSIVVTAEWSTTAPGRLNVQIVILPVIGNKQIFNLSGEPGVFYVV